MRLHVPFGHVIKDQGDANEKEHEHDPKRGV